MLRSSFFSNMLLTGCVVLTFSLLPIALPAQIVPPISSIGIDDGLSNNSVRTILQDSKGFMWFGTYDGLNRYDGNAFKIFRNRVSDSASLINNVINVLSEDQMHQLWIGTRQGVCYYSPLEDRFFYPLIADKPHTILNDVIRDIKADRQNNVFIGSETQGLFVYRNGKKLAQKIPIAGHTGIESYGVQSIVIDSNAHTYVFLQGKGLYLFDYKRQQLVFLTASTERAFCMVDRKNELLLGAGPSVISIDKKTLITKKIFSLDTVHHPNNLIWSLLPDKDDRLWVGSSLSGLNIIDAKTGGNLPIGPGDSKRSIAAALVYSIAQDNKSRIWIGTARGGINVFDPQKQKIETIIHDPADPASLSGNIVSAVYEYSDSLLWVGVEGAGINIWNRNKNVASRPAVITPNDPLASEFIVDIVKDSRGDLWLASFIDQVYGYRAETRNFKHYNFFNTDGVKRSKVAVCIYEDRHQDLWVSSLRQGDVKGALYLLNVANNQFELFDSKLSDLFYLLEDDFGDFWGAGLSDIVRIDRNTKKHLSFYMGNTVRGLFREKVNELWIGTEGGGLILFDPTKNVIVKRYTTEDGLCNNSITALLDDKQGNLWISSNNGISCFNRAYKTFTNFSKNDGLQSNQFNFNVALRLRSGELAFGGIKGLNIFYPTAILPTLSKPGLFLTTININGTDANVNSPFVEKVDTENIRQLKVPYKDAVFKFEFSSPEFSTPDKIQYSYYMEGWDKTWNHAGKDRTALYSHLSEGNYTFRVRAAADNRVKFGNEIALSVMVLPPWYRAWWAYALYSVIIGGTVYAFYTYRVKQKQLMYEANVERLNAAGEKAEREKKQAELDKELAEHKQDKAEHALALAEKETERIRLEKENEINSRRNDFFTNISHEFRTPLTLIINPVKDLIQKENTGNQADDNELGIIYRNARRMLSLVDQLLLFRKAESGVDAIRITRLNFYELGKEVYLCFVQQAKAKNIDYTFECKDTLLELYVDREKLEIVLYNLLSNALKYTPVNGRICFSISENETAAIIEVSDTGTGIAPEIGNKLFEKFFQSGSAATASKPGFGIGLYLVKHFTEQHYGQVAYQSQVGIGTTFTIELLKGVLHFGEQLVHTTDQNAPFFLEELSETEEAINTKNELPLKEIVSERKSLLIADDDAQMRSYVASVFKTAFTIYEAQNGEEGVQLAKEHLPAIIISDIKMEGGNGIDFCKAIKTHPSLNHIPVILLTGTSSESLKLEGIEGGADDYILKPFHKDMLIARVDNLLKTRTNLQKYFYNEITLNRNDLKISAEYKAFIEKCIAITNAHLDKDQFTVQDLAKALGMSYSAVYKKIKEISGQSVTAFIRFIRLRKAAELFINTDETISRISFQVGISDKTHFRESFKKVFGMSPADYIKKFRKPFNQDYHINKSNFKQSPTQD